jgi:hypothetical protein
MGVNPTRRTGAQTISSVESGLEFLQKHLQQNGTDIEVAIQQVEYLRSLCTAYMSGNGHDRYF